jgi:glutathione S-transferase
MIKLWKEMWVSIAEF